MEKEASTEGCLSACRLPLLLVCSCIYSHEDPLTASILECRYPATCHVKVLPTERARLPLACSASTEPNNSMRNNVNTGCLLSSEVLLLMCTQGTCTV